MNNDTDAMELKPCPFCGSPAYMHCGEGRRYDEFIIKCDGDTGKTDCAIYPTTGLLLPKDKAIAAWNHRTTSLAAQDGLVEAAGVFPRIVTHEQALDAARNFIDAHFNNKDGKGVLTGIPARPDHDDLLLTDYIRQQRALSAIKGDKS